MTMRSPSDSPAAEYNRRRLQHRPTGAWALAAAMRGMSAQGLKPNDIAAAIGCNPAEVRNALAESNSPAGAQSAAGDPVHSPGIGRDVGSGCDGAHPMPGESSTNSHRST